jgi:molecular chaperone GrpE (heat shock protein)
MDLRDRDEEIRQLRQEYEFQRTRAERERAGAAASGFEALARKLAPLLSQWATMQAQAAAGRAVRAEDVLTLFGQVEQRLLEAGLTRLGAVGAVEGFDTRRHQRLSGADMRDGDPVTVRFVGYRLDETILLKALVSRQESAGAAADPDA